MATITPELRQEIEKSGDHPVRIEDPETKQAYLLVREDVYRKLQLLTVIDHSDESFFEFGEFHPIDEDPRPPADQR